MKRLILFSLIIANIYRQPSPLVRVSNGLLRGRLNDEGTFYEYQGIPYARTTFETRFQGPLPEPTWDGVFDAINENVKCPQRITKTLVIGQEACLTLNVYVPINAEGPLPVMVYMHGGGFFEGSGSSAIYGPDYLVRHDIIVVTINYRLNIQGFLCLRIKEAPGNAGLKDQVAALRWLKKNIAAFGGDADSVTIFGESAGAASASYHLLSPMSEGLFHRAILQSGSSMSPWANQFDPINMAHLLAKELGYDTRDPYELFHIFMNKSDEELVVARAPRPKGDTIISELLFIPCIEEEIPGTESFITDFPYNLLKRGDFHDVPIIIGYNNQEGLMFARMENETSVANIDIKNCLPNDLDMSDDERAVVAENVRKLYFGTKEISMETLVELSRIHGDPYFIFPAVAEIDLNIRKRGAPVFSYQFNYDSAMNVPKIVSKFGHVSGATHSDDLFYMFKPKVIPMPQRFLEQVIVNKMTTMWTNFAKYGSPTPGRTELLPTLWHPTNTTDPHVFVIDQEFTTKPLWSDQAMLMWRDIYKKYRNKLYYR